MRVITSQVVARSAIAPPATASPVTRWLQVVPRLVEEHLRYQLALPELLLTLCWPLLGHHYRQRTAALPSAATPSALETTGPLSGDGFSLAVGQTLQRFSYLQSLTLDDGHSSYPLAYRDRDQVLRLAQTADHHRLATPSTAHHSGWRFVSADSEGEPALQLLAQQRVVNDAQPPLWLTCTLGLEALSGYLAELAIAPGILFIVDERGWLVASSTSTPLLTSEYGHYQRIAARHSADAFIAAVTSRLAGIQNSPLEWPATPYADSSATSPHRFYRAGFPFWLDAVPLQPAEGLHWRLFIAVPRTPSGDRRAQAVPLAVAPHHSPLEEPSPPTREAEAASVALLQQALLRCEQRWELILRGSNDGIWEWDLSNNSLLLSPRWRQLLALDPQELPTSMAAWHARIHPDDRQEVSQKLRAHLDGNTDHYFCEYRIRNGEGHYKWLLDRGQAQWDEEGEPMRMAGSSTDIDERKLVEDQLIEGTLFDELTQLPKRTYFIDRLQLLLQDCARTPHTLITLYVIDINRFRRVVDTLGHRVGDEILFKIASRLLSQATNRDALARIGGDIFVYITTAHNSPKAAIRQAMGLLDLMAMPLSAEGHEISLSASVGIVQSLDQTSQQPYRLATDMIRDGELALRAAKRLGMGHYAFFHSTMYRDTASRMNIETQLRSALQEERLVLYYQPIVDLRSGQIRSLEALVRWQHQQHGIIGPSDFINVAEEAGLVVELGHWALHRACHQRQRWHQQGLLEASVSVSVNVAGQQFAHPQWLDQVQQALEKSRLAPRQLRLEITETAIALNPQQVAQKLYRLRDLGVGVAIDDFGTGHSSLARLNALPVDTLKIDRSFIAPIASAGKHRPFLEAIVQMAKSLDLVAVAEGVETEQQHRLLLEMGCDWGQGYRYARPEASLERLLKRPPF